MRLDLCLLPLVVLAATASASRLHLHPKRQSRHNILCGDVFLRTTPYTGPRPTSRGPSLASPADFTNFDAFSSQAKGASIPFSFQPTFVDQKVAMVAIPGDPEVQVLATYDTAACARACVDAGSQCKGFNVYYQRVPQFDTRDGDYCDIRPSFLTMVYCQMFTSIYPTAGYIEYPDASTTGWTRNGFTSVIAGSNGYIYTPLCEKKSLRRASTQYTGPIPANGDAQSWRSFPEFSKWAKTAKVPAGFTQTFKNRPNLAKGKLIKTGQKTAYDVEHCAGWCRITPGCKGFNIYYERKPKHRLGPRGDGVCRLPRAGLTRVKCSLFSTAVTQETDEPTGRSGYIKNGFEWDYAGSNAYSVLPKVVTPNYKVPVPFVGFQPPYALGKCMFKPPPTAAGQNTLMESISVQTTDLSVCGRRCLELTRQNQADADDKGYLDFQRCNYIVAAYVVAHGKPTGLVDCMFYTKNRADLQHKPQYEDCGTAERSWRGVASYLIESYSEKTSPIKL